MMSTWTTMTPLLDMLQEDPDTVPVVADTCLLDLVAVEGDTLDGFMVKIILARLLSYWVVLIIL